MELMDLTGAAWLKAHSDPEKNGCSCPGWPSIAGLEAVHYPYCPSGLAETLGCEIRMGTKGIQSSILSHFFSKGPGDLDVPENLLERVRIPVVLKATEILKKEAGEDLNLPLIAGMEGPPTLFSHLVESPRKLRLLI